jgi:hypothetical protein
MGELSMSGINYLAVAVAAIVTFFIGGAWYSALFRAAWVKAQGFTDEQIKALEAKFSPALFFGGMLVCYFVMALVIAVMFQAGRVNTATAGIAWGALLWLVHSSLKMTDHLASGKPFAAFGIDASFQLIALLLTGAIVGGWN